MHDCSSAKEPVTAFNPSYRRKMMEQAASLASGGVRTQRETPQERCRDSRTLEASGLRLRNNAPHTQTPRDDYSDDFSDGCALTGSRLRDTDSSPTPTRSRTQPQHTYSSSTHLSDDVSQERVGDLLPLGVLRLRDSSTPARTPPSGSHSTTPATHARASTSRGNATYNEGSEDYRAIGGLRDEDAAATRNSLQGRKRGRPQDVRPCYEPYLAQAAHISSHRRRLR